MRKMFLIGLAVLALGACNKEKQAEPTDDDEQGLAQGGEHRGGHGNRFCEAPDAEARVAKMQKCQSADTAACNTQIYGSATPTKDVLCGDKDKMHQVRKCVHEKSGDDKDKRHAEFKRMRECMMGQ